MRFKLPLLALCSFSLGTPAVGADPQRVTIPLPSGHELVFRLVSPKAYRVDYPDFYVSETEVTNAQYAAFLTATKATKDDSDILEIVRKRDAEFVRALESGGGITSSSGDISYRISDETMIWRDGKYPEGSGDHPVALVTLKDATKFAQWLSSNHDPRGLFRLPTWNEWMIAAYGGDRSFPWGNQRDAKHAHTSYGLTSGLRLPGEDDSGDEEPKRTEPVRSRPSGRTPEGVYGMIGNVSEFIAEEDPTSKEYFNLGSRWMGGGFPDGYGSLGKREELSPRQDYWGYSHYSELRDCDLGFRVVLDPSKNKELLSHPRLFKQVDESWRVEPLNEETEQAGAGQSATGPESKSAGGDKPQPEAEGRSR